ncbi:MAG: family 78 glycoside hydrolase catalytic domain [Phycisphaerae bacterium]|nr:family 78 glycoside hydrolase catalytic domain [Phycisphaerae bacterium]
MAHRVAPQREEWKGLWIWGSAGLAHEHRNEYVYLRKTFRLTAPPAAAPVRVSADNRYVLYVNARFVCRGPARCEPRFQSYDEVDLAPWLRRGKNVIAALAHHYGESTFQSLERGGWGFLLDGEVRVNRKETIDISSDWTWKGIRSEAYNRKTTRYTVQLGFQEDFDAAKDVPRWARPQFNDTGWPEAQVRGAATIMPVERLEPRGIPFERETPGRFAGIVARFAGRNGKDWQDCENIGLLLAGEKRMTTQQAVFKNEKAALQSTRSANGMIVRPTGPDRFHAVVLDAGRETCGFLRIDVEAAGGEIIDVHYCEHVRPNGDAIIRSQTGALNSTTDRYRCRKGRQQHQFFSWKGFRYVLAVFRNVRRPMKVYGIDYTFTSYPVERRGAFECSDPLLNRIWETGVWTEQLCMHDAYMDCPWREQAQWWGDARVQWRVNMAAFGDQALFRRGIRQAAQSQVHDGLTYGLFPCECHSCILPDYTLVWVCSIWDYYFYTGDDSPIREHFDAVVKAMKWFENHAGKTHLCGFPGHGIWLFLDWAPLFKAGYNATFSLQYLEALQMAAKMARHLGYDSQARRYRAMAAKVGRAVVRAFWDAKGRQFWEGYSPQDRRPYRQVAQHGNTYAILTGVQKPWHRQIGRRVAWILENHDRLFAANSGGNVQRPGADHPIASSFFYAYVLQALFQTGYGDQALAGIRKLWGRMLDDGATTWYESWNHGPKTYGDSSACHAWSASPTYHLSEQVGGVTPTAPGFETVRIAPRMFDLDWAKVRSPSPRGPIEVEWGRRGRNGMNLQIKLPRRVSGVLDIPGLPQKTLTGGKHAFTAE